MTSGDKLANLEVLAVATKVSVVTTGVLVVTSFPILADLILI